MVNKIINYEGQELSNWIKNPTFLSGGYSISEQQQFVKSNQITLLIHT